MAQPYLGDRVIETSAGGSNDQLIGQLYHTIEKLEREKAELQAKTASVARQQVLYRITCWCGLNSNYSDSNTAIFLNPPSLEARRDRHGHLQGSAQIPNLDIFLERNEDIALLVYKDYNCETDAVTADVPFPKPSSESVSVVSDAASRALNEMIEDTETIGEALEIQTQQEIDAPYLFFYHNRDAFRQQISHMNAEQQSQLCLFMNYIEKHFKGKYDEANVLFSQGLVSDKTLPYLISPNEVVVTREDEEDMAYMATSWLVPGESAVQTLRVWAWEYDGFFQKRFKSFRIDNLSDKDTKPLCGLKAYPLRFAEPYLEAELRARGKEFWNCRHRKYICYNDLDGLRGKDNVSYSRS
jgi:hypothetical protein